MPDYKTRLIILSMDINLRLIISKAFQNNPNIEIVTNVFSVAQLSSQCIKNRKNVIVIDMEIQPGVEAYLKSMYEKFNVLIILLNGKVIQGSAYIEAVVRPVRGNLVSEKSFMENLKVKIDRYLRDMPNLSVRELSATVDENQKIIVIASSTGGTEALVNVLQKFRANSPPTLIVQHMPMGFTKLYADRIDKICSIEVREATDGDYLKRGLALIAPGDFHMKLVKKGSKLCVNCFYSDKLHGVRPAADILFVSVANIMGRNSVGVILTGMGSDGAKGLYEMHLKGAHIVGQDKASCVVYGMPKVAYDMGAVDKQLHLDKIGDYLMSIV